MKYYRTVFAIEVLSNEPLPELSCAEIHYEITEGHCSGMFLEVKEAQVTEREMEELLINQNSDPRLLMDDDD